ncbi:MAG TPA: response regulator transcription factor [Gaiellaceae bacterium]|nr:response regulator transcription factor [Gaiellaceae bacterium]
MSGDDDSCTVVVCDDQAAFRQLVAIVLGLESGIQVVGEAGNGREAVALVEELQPDVLLLDIAMPEMDGLETLPRVREASPATQVVMLTGVTAASVRERALATGASAFIEKGIDIDKLGNEIVEICRGRRLQG